MLGWRQWRSLGAYLAREMEESGERMIGLSAKLEELALCRELDYDFINHGSSPSS